MELYLIRHADAERKTLQKSDFERELTESGKIEFAESVKNWKNLIRKFDKLISSPYKRAVQTAEIVKEIYKFEAEIIEDERLSSGCDTKYVVEMLNEYDDDKIAIFGHEPDFSQHVSSLISSSGAMINFKKGAVAKISFPGKARFGGGALDFLIPIEAYFK